MSNKSSWGLKGSVMAQSVSTKPDIDLEIVDDKKEKLPFDSEKVVLIGIDLPFIDMVILCFKLTLASIPTVLFIGLLWYLTLRLFEF